ncbi:hypothetical protein O181_105157 [Austropuccinia psidii MF-1]|uniref:Integrase catalytic domain-containing protein n=1 Tax=Austropuccinia psidii MF-1 TaxID=1389203 RepID=A0A9Q3JPI0_9BASI|nr:hypothetical protein [Austropuccinia psidii MF-1]
MMKVVPSAYHQYLDVISQVKAEKRLPHCTCDYHIELWGSLPPVGVIYSLSNQESDNLRAYILGNVEKGFLWQRSSFAGAPVLFVKKKHGGLLLCVDYHKLNAVTRKNKYPFPPMNQLLTVFNGPSIFSNIYLHGAYNLLIIKKDDENLTCFRTKYGIYEYFVMLFGLTNSPASFQNLVNDVFNDLLDSYVLVYLDDIMVFCESEEENVTHVSTVLSRIRANNPFAKASKCLFHVSSVENLKDVQPFLGFANFYHHFIKNSSKKISSLTSFLKKDAYFPLNEEALRQFHQLKEAFTTSQILSHFNPSLPTILESNASDYALGAVLSQVTDSGKHPIAFNSFKPLPAELNYEIHDKEPLDSHLPSSPPGLVSLLIPFFNHLPPWPREDSQACQAEFSLVWNDRIYQGLCLILSTVFKKQKYSSQEVWTPQTSSNSKWSLDFITQLPLSNSFDSILVIVDRFSKMAVFIPKMSAITSMDLAHLLIKNIFSKNFLLSRIVSDRGSLFVSSFWTNLCQKLKISRDLSTSYHPETDGRTERVNLILEH